MSKCWRVIEEGIYDNGSGFHYFHKVTKYSLTSYYCSYNRNYEHLFRTSRDEDSYDGDVLTKSLIKANPLALALHGFTPEDFYEKKEN